MSGADPVRAAGAVLVSGGDIAVVHRPRYDDWSLPKGKLHPGEDDAAAALREVEEETGFGGEILADLGTVEYAVGDGAGGTRRKLVRYYLMRATGPRTGLEHEVDEIAWLAPAAAASRLSYERDRELVRTAVERFFPQNADLPVAERRGAV